MAKRLSAYYSLSITSKIWLSISILLIGYAISTFFGYSRSHEMDHRLTDASEYLFPASMRSQMAETFFNQQTKLYEDSIMMAEPPFLMLAEEKSRDTHNALKNTIDLMRAAGLNADFESKLLLELESISAAAQEVYGKLIVDLEDEEYGERARALARRISDMAQNLNTVTQNLGNAFRSEFSTVINEAQEQNAMNLVIFGFVVLISFALVALIVMFTIKKPLKQTVALAQKIADGDLSQKLEIRQRDEIGELMQSINTMAEKVEASHETLVDARKAAEEASLAKSQFLAKMSHEIRTPMNGIFGMTDLLICTPLNSKQLRFAKIIKSSAQSLLSLINSILDFSKIEAGKMEVVPSDFSLQIFIKEVLELFAIKAKEKNVSLISSMSPEIPDLLTADQEKIRQILVNLMGNAFKFTSRGEVRINLIKEAEIGEELLLRFVISDTGEGIPEDKIHKLFNLFSQVDASTSRRFGGTGLGLAISKRLAELLGGEIGVTSKVGKGSSFWFTVRVTRQRGTKEEDDDKQALKQLEHLQVLVVDGNKTRSDALCAQLSVWGCHTVTASNRFSALLSAHAGLGDRSYFDVIFLNSDTSARDSLQLARKIKIMPEFKGASLILMTSIDEQIGVSELIEAGFIACLTEPVTQSEIYNTLLKASLPDPTFDPAFEPVPVSAAAPASMTVERTASSLRVLLVEDNEINQEVASEILKQLGHECDVVDNGQKAVDTIFTREYDVVLMDCSMPVMDGFQATRIIRNKEKILGPESGRIPIIALTANAIKGDRERCIEAGMDHYLCKPFEVDKLIEVLEETRRTMEPKTKGNAPRLDKETNLPPATAPLKGREEPSPPSATAALKVGEETERVPDPPIAFDELLDRCIGNTDIMAKVLDKFKNRWEKVLEKITSGVEKRNAEEIAAQSHALKGIAANLSAEALRKAAHDLENSGRTGDLERVDQQLETLRKRLCECIEYLAEADHFLERKTAKI